MTQTIIWQVLYWGWVAWEVFIAVSTRTKRDAGNVRDRGSQALLWMTIATAMTACEWIRHIVAPDLFGGGSWLTLAGILVLAAGLVTRWIAIRTLGQAFSANVAIKDSQKICRAGLYRYLRHPSYLGLWLVFLGVGLHSRNWISFLAAIVPTTAALVYRIQVEERALREAFGEEYVAYSRESWRMLPGIY
jgi:protein-S-isoprenylcysteine O-methyltransferase Ste14